MSALSGVLDEAFRLARVRVGAEIAVTTRIARLCARLRESADPAAPLGDVIAAAAEAVGIDGGIVHLSEAGGIRVVASRDVPRSITDAFESFGPAGSPLLAVRGQVVVEHADEPSVADPDLLLLALQQGGIHAYVSTPLVSASGRAFGALSLMRSGRGAIGDRERLLLARVAQQLAESLDRRKEDATRARNEASLRAILDSVSEAIVTIDGSGTVLSANPAVERILGYQPDELIGRNLAELIPERERESHVCGLHRYVAGDEAKVLGRSLEVMARRKDGSDVAVELAVTEIEPRRLFTGVMRDITERRATEARLRQSDRLTSLGTLAAGLGHDMNNVLFPVRAHLNALLSDAERSGAADRKEHVSQIGRGVEYLQKLADGLHYLVHDPGNADGGLDGARLADWWRGTGPLLSRGLPPLSRVDVEIPEGLPRVRASEHALTQAVLNLFVNAGEAIASVPGGPAAHVRIAAHAAPDGRAVLLSVADNGPGMPESVRKRAFDMFFTTKTRGLGTGLGLALVSRVAREAGGSASIESCPGKGTVVTLRLPVADTEPLFAGVGVAVTAADGRAGAFIESALAGRGFAVLPQDRLHEARAWFVDPRIATPSDAMAWKRGRAEAAVILVGAPHRLHRKEWAGIADGTIDSIKDFDSLLVGVDRACSSIQRRWADERDDHACGTEAVAGARDGAQEGDQPDHGPRATGGACPFRR